MTTTTNYFVYVLIDPNTNQIFYVGKGKRYRDKTHLKPSLWKEPKNTTNPFLYYKIKSLMENNNPPKIAKLYENLSNKEACEIEVDLIKKYGRRFVDGGVLFNLQDTPSNYNSGKPVVWSEERLFRHRKFNKERRLYDPSHKELFEDYIVKGKTRLDIAKENSCSEVLVKKRLKELGISKPKNVRYPAKNVFKCIICGTVIIVPHCVIRKYCSKECYGKKRSD